MSRVANTDQTTEREMLDKIDYRDYTIEIHLDEYPESPRTWDNVSLLVQLNSRHFTQPDAGDWRADKLLEAWEYYGHDTEKTERYARAFLDAVAVSWWDDPRGGSRILGIICRDDAEREQLSDPEATLEGELETYVAWAQGDVYGYVVISPADEEIDSCWGYYGDSDRDGDMLDQAKASVDHNINATPPKGSK